MKSVRPTTWSFCYGASLSAALDLWHPWSNWVSAVLAILLWTALLVAFDKLWFGIRNELC